MNRDETIALFLKCEAKRAEALAAGKSADEAHDAAKAHWNAWAEALLAERKAMESDGRWSFELGNEATRDWFSRAKTDFSFCLVLNKSSVNGEKEAEAKAALEKRAAEAERDIKSIPVDTRKTRFDGFVFPGHASFERATFSGEASFERATFSGYAWFESATFSGNASFGGATFSGHADFESASFSGPAYFRSATFSGNAWFESAAFSAFSGDASFRAQTFTQDVCFKKAKFGAEADFALATFKRVVQFDGATFKGEADFNAVAGERTFSMAGSNFDGVPDFIQAHFAEAPRLDNVVVKGRILSAPQKPVTKDKPEKDWRALPRHIRGHRYLMQHSAAYRWADGKVRYNYWRVRTGIPKDSDLRGVPARWRALKRLAIQGHDTDRELAFFSGEVRSARFAGDWPVPWPVWKAEVWGGFFRFWFGILYEVFSDFGRSLFRPFLFWFVAACVAFYLSQTDVMQRDLSLPEASYVSAAAQAGRYAMSNSVPCYPSPPTFTEWWRSNWGWWRVLAKSATSEGVNVAGTFDVSNLGAAPFSDKKLTTIGTCMAKFAALSQAHQHVDAVIFPELLSQAGGAQSAEALSGLARAFIYAQARTLLVTHWEVDSDATVKLVTGAVRGLAAKQGIGRAEALRRSMLALIDNGEEREGQPAVWAPFVVVGEGGAPERSGRAP